MPSLTSILVNNLGYFVAVSITAILLVQSFRSWYRLRHFKGPLLAATSKLWIIKCVYQKNLHLELKRLCEEYDTESVVRVSPNDLVTSNLNHVLKMSSVRSPYSRSEIYSNVKFDYEMNHVFSERNESRHLELRRKLASGYSGKENPFLEMGIDTQIKALTHLLDSKYLSSGGRLRPLDFSRLAQFFTLDVITEVAFGEAFGFLLKDDDINGYCRVAEQALPAFEWLGVFPTLNKIIRLPGIRSLVMPSAKDATGVGMMMGYAKRIVNERFNSTKEPKSDMLGSFEKHGLSKREAETEATLQIMAGSDTTVTAPRATLLFIITNPKVYHKVQDELDRNAAAHGSVDESVIVSDTQTGNLVYLRACIRESIRVMPPAFAMLQKQVPLEGDTIDGRFVPGGTRIGTCVYGIVRSKEIFGEDADLFRPEGWLEADGERLKRMTTAADIVFGSGRYHCLGKTVAMFELRKTLATLLLRYDIAILDPAKPWVSVPANGLHLQSEMWVRVERRLPQSMGNGHL